MATRADTKVPRSPNSRILDRIALGLDGSSIYYKTAASFPPREVSFFLLTSSCSLQTLSFINTSNQLFSDY